MSSSAADLPCADVDGGDPSHDHHSSVFAQQLAAARAAAQGGPPVEAATDESQEGSQAPSKAGLGAVGGPSLGMTRTPSVTSPRARSLSPRAPAAVRVRERSLPPYPCSHPLFAPIGIARLTASYADCAAAAAAEEMERRGEAGVAAAEAVRLSQHLREHSAADDLRATQLALVLDPGGELVPRRDAGSPLGGP